MAIRNINYLKGKFETGDRPTQQDFYDLIDTMFYYGTGYNPPISVSGVSASNVFNDSSVTGSFVSDALDYLQTLVQTSSGGTITLPQSANWESTYTTVYNNSASWGTGGASVPPTGWSLYPAVTDVDMAGFSLTNVGSASISFQGGEIIDSSKVIRWDSTQTTVAGNSGLWGLGGFSPASLPIPYFVLSASVSTVDTGYLSPGDTCTWEVPLPKDYEEVIVRGFGWPASQLRSADNSIVEGLSAEYPTRFSFGREVLSFLGVDGAGADRLFHPFSSYYGAYGGGVLLNTRTGEAIRLFTPADVEIGDNGVIRANFGKSAANAGTLVGCGTANALQHAFIHPGLLFTDTGFVILSAEVDNTINVLRFTGKNIGTHTLDLSSYVYHTMEAMYGDRVQLPPGTLYNFNYEVDGISELGIGQASKAAFAVAGSGGYIMMPKNDLSDEQSLWYTRDRGATWATIDATTLAGWRWPSTVVRTQDIVAGLSGTDMYFVAFMRYVDPLGAHEYDIQYISWGTTTLGVYATAAPYFYEFSAAESQRPLAVGSNGKVTLIASASSSSGYPNPENCEIYKTDDDGATWTQVWNSRNYGWATLAVGGSPGANTAQIKVVDDNTYFVAFAIYQINNVSYGYKYHIYRTQDGGTTWIDVLSAHHRESFRGGGEGEEPNIVIETDNTGKLFVALVHYCWVRTTGDDWTQDSYPLGSGETNAQRRMPIFNFSTDSGDTWQYAPSSWWTMPEITVGTNDGYVAAPLYMAVSYDNDADQAFIAYYQYYSANGFTPAVYIRDMTGGYNGLGTDREYPTNLRNLVGNTITEDQYVNAGLILSKPFMKSADSGFLAFFIGYQNVTDDTKTYAFQVEHTDPIKSMGSLQVYGYDL